MSTTPDLRAIVKGPLAEMEQAVIELLKRGGEDADKFRTTISVDAVIALAAIRAAASARRDFSTFCTIALEDYAKAHARPSAELAEIIAMIPAVAEKNSKLPAQLRALLTKATREARASAA